MTNGGSSSLSTSARSRKGRSSSKTAPARLEGFDDEDYSESNLFKVLSFFKLEKMITAITQRNRQVLTVWNIVHLFFYLFWSTRLTHNNCWSLFSYMSSVRPYFTYASIHFSKLCKTNQFSSENSDRYWRDCGSGREDHWWHLSSFLCFFPFFSPRFGCSIFASVFGMCPVLQ